MSRKVNVTPQKVYTGGGPPLELPLVTMSSAEGVWMENQPQIYDKDYPLDWDGLGINPSWWQDTGVGTSLQGFDGLGADPVFNDAYAGKTYWDYHTAQNVPVTKMVRIGSSNGPEKLGVWNWRTRSYDVALADKLMAAQRKRREYDNWTARQRDLPTPWPGNGFAYRDPGGLGDVGGGNVRLMPWEKGYGFSGLGVTAAQQKAQAAAAAKKQAVADAIAAGQKKAAAAKAGVKAAQEARQSYSPASTAREKNKTTASQPKEKNYSAQISACQKKGGAWSDALKNCDMTAVTSQKNRDACAKRTGYIWDATANQCVTDPNYAVQQQQAACEKRAGYTWDANGKRCQSPQDQCVAQGLYWNGTTCISKTQQDCVSKGGTWDVTTGVCQPIPGTQSNCPTAPTGCSTGMIIGTDANGCTVCVVDQTNQSQLQIQQCQQSGGQWNGTYCVPPQSYPGGAGGGGGLPPGPLPSFDPSAGDMPAAGMPIMSQGATGGSFPMQQGQGPTAFDESSGQFDIAPPATSGDEQGNADQQEDNGTKDSTADVADGNVLESISKMFGFGSLSCGCDKPPTWFNDYPGGNAPMLGAYAQQPVTPPIARSTETAVYVTALVAVVGAAAVFLWSKSGRK